MNAPDRPRDGPSVLFMSRVVPSDPARAVAGHFQRLRLLLEACHALGGRLRCLFFTGSKGLVQGAKPPEIRDSILTSWGFDIDPVLVATASRPTSWWNTYVLPMISYAEQKDYWPVGGPAQAAALERELPGIDLVVIHRLSSMLPVLRVTRPRPPMILDLDDVEHIKFRRELYLPPHWPGKYLLRLQIPALRRLERLAIRTSARTLVCSTLDQNYLRRLYGTTAPIAIPNAVEMPAAIPPLPNTNTVAFVGTFSYDPNVDAAEYLITRVWPLVLAECPQARLIIAGPRPERIPSHERGAPTIEFTGFVPSIESIYRRADIVCCPILSGGGTRVKIIEAAAYGRPAVSTTLGAEGLEFRDGLEILLADDAKGLAQRCVCLLADSGQARRVGTAARELAREHYNRPRVVERLVREMRTTLAEHAIESTPI